jgi:glycosyltransferase involved in cell wall biosynthesis
MCCGTPVIAFNRGAMPELIIDRKTGYLVSHIDEAADAVNDLHRLERADCRVHVEKSFSRHKMTDDYLKVYDQVLRR